MYIDAVSHNWFDRCFHTGYVIFEATAETFRRVFHINSLVTACLILLIILPMLFQIYGFGIQYKLRNFYNHLRLGIVTFMILLAFLTSISTVCHLWIKQQVPCMKWTEDGLQQDNLSHLTPDPELLITYILCAAIWSFDLPYKLLRRIFAGVFLLVHIFSVVFSGYTSWSNALSTLSLGFWCSLYFDFIPPIFSLFTLILTFVANSVVCTISILRYGIINVNRNDVVLGFRSLIIIIITVYLYVRLAFTRSAFNWMHHKWSRRFHITHQGEESSDNGAIIPFSKSDKDDQFMPLLKKDLIDAIICFIFFLITNYILSITIFSGFNYKIYD